MITLVLEASVVLKWFAPPSEGGSCEARRIRRRYAAGEIQILEPPLLILEASNVAGRRWGWDEPALVSLAQELERLGFVFALPRWSDVAGWVARGLTAYDAAYVSLAAEHEVELISDDDGILSVAGDVARPLVGTSG